MMAIGYLFFLLLLLVRIAGAESEEVGGTSMPGSSWCVAKPNIDDSTLQAGLTYACGQGLADCDPIKLGHPCFLPNTVFQHASYAFNSYFQQHVRAGGTCSFDSAAYVTTTDPSQGTCIFPSSGSLTETISTFQTNSGNMRSSQINSLYLLAACIVIGKWYLL